MSFCFDFSQFVRMPHRSDAQRVLHEVARRCDEVDRFGVVDQGGVLLVHPVDAAEMLGSVRRSGSHTASSLLADVRLAAAGRVAVADVFRATDCYALADPTIDRTILAVWEALRGDASGRMGAFAYHAMSETETRALAAPAPVGQGWYFQLLAGMPQVACASEQTAAQLARLSRRSAVDFPVVPLGGDHLEVAARRPGNSIVVMCDAGYEQNVTPIIEILTSRARLDVALVRLSESGQRAGNGTVHIEDPVNGRQVSTSVDPSDEQLRDLLAAGRGCVCLTVSGAYGLSALEALSASVPVIVDDALPSVQEVESDALVRLRRVDAETLQSGVARLVDRAALAPSAKVGVLDVPSWDQFAQLLRAVLCADGNRIERHADVDGGVR